MGKIGSPAETTGNDRDAKKEKEAWTGKDQPILMSSELRAISYTST